MSGTPHDPGASDELREGDDDAAEQASDATIDEGTIDVEATAAFTSVFEPVKTSDRVHSVVVVEGEAVGKRFEVGEVPVTVGRAGACDVVLDDARVSGRHCAISLVLDDVIVKDLGSTNGTFIDGERIERSRMLPPESLLQLGTHTLRHEHRSRAALEQERELAEDLRKARSYVEALLPEELDQDIVAQWRFVPSAVLGGDAFTYLDLDERHFLFCLIDVSGHGAGAAMHSVSVINMLRQRTLPSVDFRRPDEILTALNTVFPMESHDGQYFTAWCAVYDRELRELHYASAGHPAALLLPPGREPVAALRTRGLGVGMLEGVEYECRSQVLEPGSSLYVFSDGAYEVVTKEGRYWTLKEFEQVIAADPVAEQREVDRIQEAVMRVSQSKELDDDFSLVMLEFR